MKMYEVKVEHDLEGRSFGSYYCTRQTYFIAATNPIEAKIKAVERFRNEVKLKVICEERDVQVVESSLVIQPPEETAKPWWKRLG